MIAARIALLVGSGISRSSGVPMVNTITEQILKTRWQADTRGGFHGERFKNPFGNELADKPQELIRRLHGRITDHIRLRDDRQPNYEDWFSCLWQIVQDETYEHVNPAIADFNNAFKAENSDLWQGYPSSIADDTGDGIRQNQFASLASKACDLIEWAVYNALEERFEAKGLELILTGIREMGISDIFSLNHDLLLERYLRGHGVEYSDGFQGEDGDARFFNRVWHEHSVRLLKLHGSINWHRFHFRWRGVTQYGRIIANADAPKDAAGVHIGVVDEIPRFLTGTIGKELAYGNGLFADIFRQFRTRLDDCNTLIASGYGWGDKGINVRISDWLAESPINRLVILHDDSGEPLRTKRFFYTRWDRYSPSGRLVVIPKWLCDCTVSDIQPYLR